MALKLDTKDVGHSVNIERYTDAAGNTVAMQVSTTGDTECHYQVIDRNGNRSGMLYTRDAALKIAADLALNPKPNRIPDDGMNGLNGTY